MRRPSHRFVSLAPLSGTLLSGTLLSGTLLSGTLLSGTLLLCTLLCSSRSAAQEAEDAGVDASEEGADAGASLDAGSSSGARAPIEPLPAAEIGRRIEETFQELQALTPLLRRQAETLAVQAAIPNFVANVTRLSNDNALNHLETLHPASLRDLEHEWGRVRSRLKEWQDTLELRTQSLTEARAQTATSRRLWLATREADIEEPLPETQIERIDSLIERVDNTLERIDKRFEEVLGLQGELSDQGIIVARQISRIDAAQQNVRERRQQRDHRPLWLGWSRLGDEESAAPKLTTVLAEHAASIRAFAYSEKKSLVWHGASLVGLALFFLWLRLRSKSKLTARRRPSAQRTLRLRPIASALVLVHILAPLLYGYVPVVAVGTSLILMVPAIHLLNRQLLRVAHRPILALLVLAALSVPLSLNLAPEWSRRFYVLALQVAALVAALQFWSPSLTKKIVTMNGNRRRLYGLLRLTVLPLVFALYLLISGYTERAELWTTGTLWAVEQGIGLFAGVEIMASLLTFALRRPSARALYMVRDHRRVVARYLLGALNWVAVVLFFLLALNSFDLLDPTLESSRSAFRATFTFGSIELSFGAIVAFFAMLIGTFACMRLVHVMLEHEILPRFELEQGISSAISLSASYLLVAIGVVLAFGVAGVGPERLALLGGALGVGIGFGLQNVVSNFVSGLILVAERPIKVGDIIEVGGDLVGTVQRIGIRSSTVHSLDGAEVIVPNADLVSGQLINWTLSDTLRRIELVVGASYAHDPQDVMRVLTRVAGSQHGILQSPPPSVTCSAFADSSIEYKIRAWAPGYLEAIETKSQLAARVYEAFAADGIEIPFPQQDLHLKTVSDKASKALGGEGGKPLASADEER